MHDGEKDILLCLIRGLHGLPGGEADAGAAGIRRILQQLPLYVATKSAAAADGSLLLHSSAGVHTESAS